MQTQTILLETVYDPSTGDVGLVTSESISNLFATDSPMLGNGSVIAHDIMEHVNGLSNIGGVGEECEALGATFQTRAWSGTLRSPKDSNYGMYSALEGLANDLEYMYDVWASKGFEAAVPTNELTVDIEDELTELYSFAMQALLANDSCIIEPPTDCEEYLDACLTFMRVGYTKAIEKYPCRLEAMETFFAIAEAIDDCIKMYNLNDNTQEGMEFELTFGSCTANINYLTRE